MGYELEVEARAFRPSLDGESFVSLERRWSRANDRLAAALADYQSLRGRVHSTDPQWQAAQLRVAEARQRQREVHDEIERLEATLDETWLEA